MVCSRVLESQDGARARLEEERLALQQQQRMERQRQEAREEERREREREAAQAAQARQERAEQIQTTLQTFQLNMMKEFFGGRSGIIFVVVSVI